MGGMGLGETEFIDIAEETRWRGEQFRMWRVAP